MIKTSVLVVDDEPATIRFVSANLRARGYVALTAVDGRAALKVFSQSSVDLIILGIVLPGLGGFQVCQAVRAECNVPIIMLSARGQECDIVRALDSGADDCLTKPFGAGELMARVRAALRRSSPGGTLQRPPLVLADLTIDFATRSVSVKDRLVDLTRTEFDLLPHLAINAGRVLTHRALLQAVWGPEYGDETEYLWTYIKRLRRSIEPDPRHPCHILTRPGVGYAFAALT